MLKHIHGLSRVLLLLPAILILAAPTPRAWAHGGGVPRLTNAEAGPYWVSVWTQPDPLRVGQTHITVAISEPTKSTSDLREAGPPVLNARVEVQFDPLDQSGETLSVLATHEDAANKLLYEADLELPLAGQWVATVRVEGPEGSGDVGFDAQVSPPQSNNGLWIAGLGVLTLVAIWVIQKIRNRTS